MKDSLSDTIRPEFRDRVFASVENELAVLGEAHRRQFTWDDLQKWLMGLGLTGFAFAMGFRMLSPGELSADEIAEVIDDDEVLFEDLSEEDFELLASNEVIEGIDHD